MRRLLSATLVVMLAIVAAPAVAQEGPRGPFVDEAFAGVVAFLQLDEFQADAFATLLEQRDLDATPVREALIAVNEAIRAEIDSEEPDPTVIGELVLERVALQQTLGDIQRTFVDGFVAMLDEEQNNRLNLVRAAKRVQRIIPAFERFGLLLPPTPDEETPDF